MKVLVIGSGGREHAIVWKLAQSPHVSQLWCAPGNGGIGLERLQANREVVVCVPAGAEDLPALLAFAREKRPDLTVVGPDNPLALGIVDVFQADGLRIWGPNRMAARFESSKAFSQEFMARHGIPTAQAATFQDVAAARAFASRLGGKCAVKADGLALGKGVLLCHSEREAEQAIDAILVRKEFGSAGNAVVIQEFLEGTEVSLHALCDGRSYALFPSAQDHKRARDGDQGPNTGGMGAFSPAPFLGERELRDVGEEVLGRWLRGCKLEGIDYRGVIYPGLMLTDSGAKVLEFNARFGDPETQVYLTRLDHDLLELLDACLTGSLGRISVRWSVEVSVCVVLASPGYPGAYVKGQSIQGLERVARRPKTKVFHAGTKWSDGRYFTNGGRVLGVTAWAPTLQAARDAAYEAVDQIEFEGAHYRRDIGAKALGITAGN